jgi:hypothetical protein
MSKIKQTHSGMIASITNFFAGLGKKDLQVKASTDKSEQASLTARQVRKVCDATKYNYEKMKKVRKTSKEMREQFMSHLVADTEEIVVINKLQDAVRIWLQNMASGDPRVSIEAKYPQLRAFAANFERATNEHLLEIDLGNTLVEAVTNAFFDVGVLKTGLGEGAPEIFELDGEMIDPGRPFTEVIHIDDFVIDMSAKTPDKIDMIGHRYYRPKAWVREMTRQRDKDNEDTGIEDRMESEMQPEEKLSGAREGDDDSKIYDMVPIWEIYLPKENKIVNFVDGSEKPLAIWKWEGPEGGPYNILGWLYSPGHPLPIPPVSNIYQLHLFLNDMVQKTGRQARNQKSMVLVEQGSEKAGEIIRDNNDNAIAVVPAGTLDKVKEVKYGGADPMSQQSVLWAGQVIDVEGGNLTTLGGTGPSAETARGDAMIHENASALIRFFQLGLFKVAKKVLRKHCWWVWTEDIRGFDGEAEIEGTGITVPWSFTPEEREGDFLDYNFDIDPNSMVGQTPMEKASAMMEMLNGVVLPNADFWMQLGYMPNIESIKFICKQRNIPFDLLFSAMDPAMQEQLMKQAGDPTSMPPRMKQSHTINERISRPGTTPQGNENVMMQSLGKMAAMGGGA